MLVVMRPDSSPAEADAVCQFLGNAGFATAVYDADITTISVRDEVPTELAEELEALAGVGGIQQRRPTVPPTTSNLRIERIRPLTPPAILMDQLPLPESGAVEVRNARERISQTLRHRDDRLLVVVGPCSVHDVDAAMEYARQLKPVADELAVDLHIVMRVYFEKPRTTVGWKGLINDPHLDESFAVNEGLHLARQLLLDIIALGLPIGCEFLDPITPQFIADVVAWAAIGARTTESQVHRNLASGLSMPVGFKNSTSGDIQIALDAMAAASFPHQFLSVTEQGLAAIVVTRGNRDTHVILRGGRTGANFDRASVQRTLSELRSAGRPERLMIDTSHGNSDKDYRRQPMVASAIAQQIADGEHGIIGVLMESFLVEGQQKFVDRDQLRYGQSITDGCMSWDMTAPVLRELAEAVRARRAASRLQESPPVAMSSAS